MIKFTNSFCILKDWLTRPFTTNLSTFSLLFAEITMFIIAYLISGSRGLGTISINIFLTYVLTIVISIFPVKVRKVILIFVLCYIGTISILAYCGAVFLKCPQAMNTLMLVLQTNSEETAEFLETYISLRNVLMLILGLLVLVSIPLILKWAKKFIAKLRYVLLALCLLCGCILIYSSYVIYVTPLFCMFEKTLMGNFIVKDLRNYITEPKIRSVSETDIKPTHVVIIIGESLSKSHCSLYGYNKTTQPCLKKMVNDSSIVVFSSVTTASTGTGSAFYNIMSTYSSRNINEDWLRCQTLPTIMKSENYKTYWISNQASMGLLDAIPNMYSKLFDEIQFSPNGNTLDEILIPMAKSQLISSEKQFMVIHLMGNHEAFSKRYSPKFNKFSSKDYDDKPEHQRQVLAEYDNSILYNDYVVSQIINLFKEEDAVVMYFPDHGLDVYESDETYFGHSLSTDESQYVGKQIPFMIYVSEKYKMHNEKLYQQLQSAKDVKFCTQDVLYMIMDITGYEFADSDDVSKYSPLHCDD